MKKTKVKKDYVFFLKKIREKVESVCVTNYHGCYG